MTQIFVACPKPSVVYYICKMKSTTYHTTERVHTMTTEAATVTAPTNAVEYNLEELMTTHKTKSAVIRYLAGEGMTRGAIAKLLNIRYQHVRNVLITPLKKG